MKLPVFIFLLFLPLLHWPAYADQKGKDDNQKQMNFEGDLVEGINKQPLDSLSQIGDQDDGKRRKHLYRKKDIVKTEIEESLRGLLETY